MNLDLLFDVSMSIPKSKKLTASTLIVVPFTFRLIISIKAVLFASFAVAEIFPSDVIPVSAKFFNPEE